MKIVPSKIYTEIADNIFRSDICRRNWKINIRAEGWSTEKRARHIAIISSVTTYDVENLNNHPITFEVTAGIDNDIDMEGIGSPFPRFESIKIANSSGMDSGASQTQRGGTGTLLNVTIPPEDSLKVLTTEGLSINYPNKKLVLVLKSTHQQIRFGVQVPVPAGQTITVEFRSARGSRVPGIVDLLENRIPVSPPTIVPTQQHLHAKAVAIQLNHFRDIRVRPRCINYVPPRHDRSSSAMRAFAISAAEESLEQAHISIANHTNAGWFDLEESFEKIL